MSDNHEKFINTILSRRMYLSELERQSIARWPGQISVCVECGWEGGPSFRRIRDDEKSFNDLNDAVKGFLSVSPLHIVAMPAMYNMFAIQVAERLAEFIMRMPGHPLSLLCCDEVLLSGLDESDLNEADCQLVDVSLIGLNANGMLTWCGDVPKDVVACLEHTSRLEQSETRRAYILNAIYPKTSSSTQTYFSIMENLNSCSLDQLEEIASFYSYGHYNRCPRKAWPEYPGYTEGRSWLCDNVNFENWTPETRLELERDDYRLLCDTFKIWRHSYEGEFIVESDGSELAEMAQFGQDNGIDSMIEALYAGVGLDDILA